MKGFLNENAADKGGGGSGGGIFGSIMKKMSRTKSDDIDTMEETPPKVRTGKGGVV